MRLLLILAVLAPVVSAQDARLVLRDAVFRGTWDSAPFDTTGWEPALLDERTVLLGDVVMTLGAGSLPLVYADLDPFTNDLMLSLKLSPDAAEAFSEVTDARRGRVIALVLDGRVLLAPRINERIPNGRIQISGSFTRKEVLALVSEIRGATDEGRP